MKNLRVARRYARALMSAAEEDKRVDAVAKDLDLVGALAKESREFRLLVSSPVVSAPKKSEIFKKLFEGRIGKDSLSFLMFMIDKGREGVLPEVVGQFAALRDKKLGIVNVDVKSAVEFTSAQQKALQKELETLLKKIVRVHLSIDESIMGGLIIKAGDTVFDGSVSHQLEVLRERFVEGGAFSN